MYYVLYTLYLSFYHITLLPPSIHFPPSNLLPPPIPYHLLPSFIPFPPRHHSSSSDYIPSIPYLICLLPSLPLFSFPSLHFPNTQKCLHKVRQDAACAQVRHKDAQVVNAFGIRGPAATVKKVETAKTLTEMVKAERGGGNDLAIVRNPRVKRKGKGNLCHHQYHHRHRQLHQCYHNKLHHTANTKCHSPSEKTCRMREQTLYGKL